MGRLFAGATVPRQGGLAPCPSIGCFLLPLGKQKRASIAGDVQIKGLYPTTHRYQAAPGASARCTTWPGPNPASMVRTITWVFSTCTSSSW